MDSSAEDFMCLVHVLSGICYTAFFFLFLLIAIPITQAAFGQGTGSLVLKNIGCSGTESSLLRCSHQVVGVTTCSHSEDAGVVCPTCKLCTSVLVSKCNIHIHVNCHFIVVHIPGFVKI